MLTRRPFPLLPRASLFACLLALGPTALGQTGRVIGESELAPGLRGFVGAQAPVTQFGSSVAAVGDLDGDGGSELAVGDLGGGPSKKGVVWLLSFDAAGNVRREVAIGEGLGGFTGTLVAGATFGYSVCALGDVDGDGVPDLGVGAPSALDYTQERGSFFVLLLRDDGTVRATQEIGPGVGGFGGSIGFLSRFGWACAGLGDLDGDGRREAAVAAPWPDGTTSETGELYVLSLTAAGLVADETRISNGDGGFPATLGEDDLFGLSLAALGDLDGDGRSELGIGVGRTGSAGSFGVLTLEASGTVRSWVETDPAVGGLPGYRDLTVGYYDAVRSLAGLGDVDGDGTPDLLVGALDTLWVALLAPDGRVRRSVPVRPGLGGFQGLGTSTTLGFAAAGLGDVDGDGRADAAFGAPFDLASTGVGTGAVWLVALGDDGGATELDDPSGTGAVGPPASVRVRTGSGVNPLALSASAAPVLGTRVDLLLDVAAVGGTGVAGLVLHTRALAGLPTSFGELLVDPLSARLFAGAATSTTQAVVPVSIPADPLLAGLALFGQGVVLAAPRPVLTNALDFVLGR